jgi:hypothetical protein
MKNIFFILVGFFCFGNLFSQNLTQTIRGEVLDSESKVPLWGANIIIIGSEPLLGASTDEKGKFKIQNVPIGRQNLKISYLGYEDAYLNEILVSTGKEIILQIPLTEKLTSTEAVVITAESDKNEALNDMTSVSARQFSVEETKRYAASINDPARMALSFAGVANNGDFSNEIVVRGNSPRGLLWRVEGVEIPNPNHFTGAGSSGGGISILSANMLANSDFLTGAFPAEYGNAVSGVFDINLRNGNNQQREYALQAGVLGVDFAFEGPFKEGGNSSYLVNYRYSTLAMLNLIGVDIAGDVAPQFQDLSFKFNFPTKKAGVFSFWGLGGLSSQEETNDEEFYKYGSNTGATGVSHILFLDKKTYLETVVSYSGSELIYNEEQFTDTSRPSLEDESNLRNTSLRVSTLFNRKLNAKNTIRAGLIFSQLNFNLLYKGQDDDVVKTYIDNSGGSQLYQAYAQWKNRLTEKLTLNTGLHYTLFALNGSQAIEPRLGLKWQFKPRQSFSAGFGMHSRTYNMEIYKSQRFVGNQFYNINEELDLIRSKHYVLGYDNLLKPNLRLKAEIYYQSISKVPIRPSFYTDIEDQVASGLNSSGGFTTDSLVSDGSGRNYGIEFTLERFFSNNFYFMFTTSLFESKYKGRDGVERNTRFNNNYIFNTLGGKEFKVGKNGKSNLIGLNLRAIWMGGNRKLTADLQESLQRREAVYEYGRAFEDKVKDYGRIDFRINYRKNKPKFSWVISLDIQNLTNRTNFYTEFFDEDDLQIETVEQLGLIPILNYRVEF